jgi:hypothetical protein
LITDSAGKENSGRRAAMNASPFHASSTPSGSGRGYAQRFREQLPNHPQAVGANGRPYGEFVLPLGASRQQQDGNIGATD